MILEEYYRAGYPIVAVEVADELHFQEVIRNYFAHSDSRPVMRIDSTGQLKQMVTDAVIATDVTFADAFDRAINEECVLVVYDWYRVADNFGAIGYRGLLNRINDLRSCYSFIILVAPFWQLPVEIRLYIPIVPFPLPTRKELRNALETIKESAKLQNIDNELENTVLDSISGLSILGAENALALSCVRTKTLDPATIENEKTKLIRQQTGLEIANKVQMTDVGGLANLKRWVLEEVVPNRRDPLLAVRAALFVGPPGTGKSYMAKAIGSLMNLPVIRLDLASCRGQYVGQTESTVKSALRTVDAIAPCILWLDEIDSALGGHTSSAMTDGGVTLNILSILLTWMQEHSSEVLLLATANYPDRIPAALLRPGRLDAIWCVDLPRTNERKEIAEIHLRRIGCDAIDISDYIAQLTEGFSGAEIAGAIVSAARKTKRKITKQAIEKACHEITPLSRSKGMELAAMREWAQKYARNAGDGPEERPARTRKLKTSAAN